MSMKGCTVREKFNLNLIKEVRKYELFYDNKHPDFRNSVIKDSIWRNIANVLGESEDVCKQRWMELRKQYSKEGLKIRTPGAIRNTCWKYTSALTFLKDYEPQKIQPTQPNRNIPKSEMYCRACLCAFLDESGNLSKGYNIFEIKDLAEKLSQCSNHQVVQWDEYPQSVCEKCYRKIVYFSQFQTICRTSLEKFNTILHDPKEVTFDFGRTLDDSLNSFNEDTSLNSFFAANVNVPEEEYTQTQRYRNVTNRTSELSENKRLPHIESNIELDDTIMDEIIHIEIERNTESDDTREFEKITLPLMEEKTFEVIEANNNEIQNEEFPLENEEYVIEEEDEYIVDELSDEEESISDKVVTWDVKRSAKRQGHLKCDICPGTFHFQHRLEAHQRRHQGLSGYPCPYDGCKRAYNRLDEYRAHINDHKGITNIYICGINNCEMVFNSNSHLKLHKRRYHFGKTEDPQTPKKKYPRQNYICETCGQILCSKFSLQKHCLIHVNRTQWPYACDEKGCTRRFRLPTQLKIHKNRHAGIKNYICPYCNVHKTTSTELKIHINYHTFERKYPCRICSKVFKSAGTLSIHVRRVHELTEVFQCRFCDHKCNMASNMKHHEMTHTGEKPYACGECGKAFTTPSGRTVHMQIHAKGEKQHICTECGKRFKWLSNLTSHKKLHLEGATPYTCEECGQGFRWPGGYYGHKKRHLMKKLQSTQDGEGDDVDEGEEQFVNIENV